LGGLLLGKVVAHIDEDISLPSEKSRKFKEVIKHYWMNLLQMDLLLTKSQKKKHNSASNI
ncbi:hypothetical protein NQ317_016572, partial [Molorchus minor]